MKKKNKDLTLSKMSRKDLIALTFLIISLVSSMIGILRYGLICGIVAVITGIIALFTFEKENKEGKQLAFICSAVGTTDIVMAIVWSIFYGAI